MSAVATPCHSAQGKHSLQIQPARDGEVGWRGEGRWAERDLAGDVKQNASFSLFLFHFFPPSVSAEFSPHSLSASWPPLLFSPSHMWWKPCPAPIRASTSPTVSPLLSCPLPFLFSPFLKYIQCWHGQIARLGRDDGHHRAFRRGGGGLSCNGEEVGQRVSTGTGRSFFGGEVCLPLAPLIIWGWHYSFALFKKKYIYIFLTTSAAQCNKETKAKWASKRVDWLLEKKEVGAKRHQLPLPNNFQTWWRGCGHFCAVHSLNLNDPFMD